MFLVLFCFFHLQTGEKSGQVEKSKKNARQRQNDFKVCFILTVYTKLLFWESNTVVFWIKGHLSPQFTRMLCVLQKMIEEMTHRLVRLIRGALLPTTLPQAELSLYGGWENKTDLTGAWLTQIIHTVRFSHWLFEHVSFCLCALLTWFYAEIFDFMSAILFNDLSLSLCCFSTRGCHEALSALEIPNDLLQVIQDLLLELRVHCLMVTLLHTTDGKRLMSWKRNRGTKVVKSSLYLRLKMIFIDISLKIALIKFPKFLDFVLRNLNVTLLCIDKIQRNCWLCTKVNQVG